MTSYEYCIETWELEGGKRVITSKQRVCGNSELVRWTCVQRKLSETVLKSESSRNMDT